ncbi:MAG: hypothetical protein J6K81_02590 [Rikenellaceae bacterium]|nr:hypothetical protein [Rikenellaceae bacterium]
MSRVISIKIDGVGMEVDQQCRVSLSAEFDSLWRNGEPKRKVARLSLPATPANQLAMGFAEQMAAEPFNAVEHTLEVEMDDRVVARGRALLHSVERSPNGARYNIDVHVELPSWRNEVAQKTIAELSMDYTATIDREEVVDSWELPHARVRYLPVCRKAVNAELTGAEVSDVTKPLAADDYHPFLHLRSVMERIFQDAGYQVESDFMCDEVFDSLYMSGAYTQKDMSSVERSMGFRARRSVSTEAVADYAGCVYASTLYGSHSVGNLVDVDSSEKFGDTYNKNRCLKLIDGRLAWVPTSPVNVGFIYELKYRTDTRIVSRKRLAGFDKVWLDGATCHSFSIANPYVDHREEPVGGLNYRIVVFEASENDTFRLVYRLNGQQCISEECVGGNNQIILGQMGDALEVVRLERRGSDGTFSEWTDDWALYAGYVGLSNTVDVALTLRSTPRMVTPSSPMFMDEIVFGGADEGMTLRVESGVSIRPVFYAFAVEGAQVTWSDVAAVECTQAEVVDAVCGMFNLKVIEDFNKKRVRIKPLDTWLSRAEIMQWQPYVNRNGTVTVCDVALAQPQNIRLSYASRDAAVGERNELTEDEFGAWSAAIRGSGSSVERAEVAEVIFSPTINVEGCFVEAPGASVPKVGSVNANDEPTIERLDFPVKVLRYFGTRELAAGTIWGWPSYGRVYPYAAFHDPEQNFTLCFEDRDELKGLNSYYKQSVERWNNAKRLSVELALEPHQVAELMDYASEHSAVERIYQLGVDDESDRYMLEGVDNYSTDATSVKCRFIKIN